MYVVIFFIHAVPSEPHNLTASGVIGNPYQINISWQPPLHPNGNLTGYNILCSSGGNDIKVRVVGMKANDYIISGLKPYTVYVCSISCNTSVGEGNMSTSITVRTDESGEYLSK